MITLTDYLRQAVRNEHNMLDEALRDLTFEQFHHITPDCTANHIAFTIWHYVRTEDNVVRFILQNRKPTVWIEGGFHERFGLDKIAQGTGMPTADAHAMRLPPVDEWIEYQQGVWQATDAYLSSVDDEGLEQVFRVVPFGELPARQALTTTVLTHGHAHLGEICVLRTLQGLPSSLI